MDTNKHVTMAQNFIYNYGKKDFMALLKSFTDGTSNETIAKNLGVTRQRVHQWKKAFTQKSIKIRDEIAKLY